MLTTALAAETDGKFQSTLQQKKEEEAPYMCPQERLWRAGEKSEPELHPGAAAQGTAGLGTGKGRGH